MYNNAIQQRPITPVKDIPDMIVYAALVGREPRIDPSLADPFVVATAARRENPWSPVLLSVYIRHVARQKFVHINRAELAAWMNRQKVIARRRYVQTRTRIRKHHLASV